MHSQRLLCLLAVLVTPVLNAQSFRNVPALQFTKVYAGADPLPQILTLASTGNKFDFRVTASTTNGGAWLRATGCGAYCDTPQAITVAVSPAVNLSPGTYVGQVVFTEYYNTFSMTVPVTLTVAAAGSTFLDTLPGQVSFTLAAGGSSPPSQGFQIRNGGAGSLNWTLTSSTADGGNWLSISPGSGTAPSHVTVSLQKNNLPGRRRNRRNFRRPNSDLRRKRVRVRFPSALSWGRTSVKSTRSLLPNLSLARTRYPR